MISSGSIAAGLEPLNLKRKPGDIASKQAAAAVGQSRLISAYTQEFEKQAITSAQVLLTAEDFQHRQQYNNAFATLNRLCSLKILPIINENDTVATDEIRFGDNDRLAALVAILIKADMLLLLSAVDAVYNAHPENGGQRIKKVTSTQDLQGISLAEQEKLRQAQEAWFQK